jgi:hypothetical protein
LLHQAGPESGRRRGGSGSRRVRLSPLALVGDRVADIRTIA